MTSALTRLERWVIPISNIGRPFRASPMRSTSWTRSPTEPSGREYREPSVSTAFRCVMATAQAGQNGARTQSGRDGAANPYGCVGDASEGHPHSTHGAQPVRPVSPGERAGLCPRTPFDRSTNDSPSPSTAATCKTRLRAASGRDRMPDVSPLVPPPPFLAEAKAELRRPLSGLPPTPNRQGATVRWSCPVRGRGGRERASTLPRSGLSAGGKGVLKGSGRSVRFRIVTPAEPRFRCSDQVVRVGSVCVGSPSDRHPTDG
jgi:hypothetical protein